VTKVGETRCGRYRSETHCRGVRKHLAKIAKRIGTHLTIIKNIEEKLEQRNCDDDRNESQMYDAFLAKLQH
jgi:hypothetical protein